MTNIINYELFKHISLNVREINYLFNYLIFQLKLINL